MRLLRECNFLAGFYGTIFESEKKNWNYYRDKPENVSFAQDMYMVVVVCYGDDMINERFRVQAPAPFRLIFLFGFRVDSFGLLLSIH